jgi:glutamate carboxypeptidase
MRATFILLGVSVVQSNPTPVAAQEEPIEHELVRYVDAHSEETRALLETVVNMNSGTMNLAGVREVGDVFRAELDALGFTTQWIDGAPFERAGHLVAKRDRDGPRLLLIGHLDTVFEPDSRFQRFEQLNDSTPASSSE